MTTHEYTTLPTLVTVFHYKSYGDMVAAARFCGGTWENGGDVLLLKDGDNQSVAKLGDYIVYHNTTGRYSVYDQETFHALHVAAPELP